MNELILSFHNETSNIYKWFKSRLVKLLEVHCRSGLYETWINKHSTIKILKFWSGSSLDISRDWADLFRSFLSQNGSVGQKLLKNSHTVCGIHFEIRFDQNFCSFCSNEYPIYTDKTWQPTTYFEAKQLWRSIAVNIQLKRFSLRTKCIKSQKLKFAQMFYL